VGTSEHFCDDPESYPYVGVAYDNALDYDLADPVTVTAFNTTSGIDLFVQLIEKRESLEKSVEDGLAWLTVRQNADGSWGDVYTLAKTGLAVLAFEKYAADKGFSPPDAASPYHDRIADGLRHIFSNAYETNISDQPAGNPDGDGDGIGVFFDAVTEDENHSHVIYSTSIAMMAIAASNSPDATVNLPGSPLDQKTYKQVLQDAVDYLAWAQTDPGDDNRGGWNYEPMDNSGDQSDQSNSGWATLGLSYAEERFGISIPEFVYGI